MCYLVKDLVVLVLVFVFSIWPTLSPFFHKSLKEFCALASLVYLFEGKEIGYAARGHEGSLHSSFSHLLGFWQWHLLSEGRRLVCHVFSQSTDGRRPTHLAFVFFSCIKLPSFHFRRGC